MATSIKVCGGLLAAVLALLANAAHAELERVNLQGSGTFAWMPRIVPPEGWRPYPGLGHQLSATVLTPPRSRQESAETIIIGKAIPKADEAKLKSLAELIERDRKDESAIQDRTAREEPTLKSADGRSFRVLVYFPKGEGIWDRVGYAEEGDFYLVFTLSTNSRRLHDEARPVFERVIREYR